MIFRGMVGEKMNKAAIKSFSIWARNKLIADITYKAGLLGITEEGIKDALPQSTKEAEFYDIGAKEPHQIIGEEIKQRKQLADIIRRKTQDLEYRESYRNVIEEVAYTWFNRLIAIRFMEVNDYMPAHVRVLSSERGMKLEPDIVTTPFEAELEFTSEEEQRILKLKNDNAVDELFRFLFIRQCNALSRYLPKLFEKTADYTELLLNVSVTDQDGIVYHLVHDIEEKDFNMIEGGQVEIIGWMYQYYNTEPKDEAFALLKKNVKISKERIPAVTQLFTPHWIVCYMVENSLGHLWLEGHPDDSLKQQWKYYLDEAEQEADVAAQLEEIRKDYQNIKPEDIKIIDPCMGSGHILVYAFDVLMQIYESYGYSQRDAAKSIVENNLYGLDIDDRAFQLAYFAVMMKARQYNRRILTQDIEPNLCAIQESNGLKMDIDMGDFLLSEEYRETLRYLLDTFVDAKEYGSILEVEDRDYAGFLRAWELTAEQTVGNIPMILWYSELNEVVPILTKQAMILSQKYDVAVTNPPYMGVNNSDEKLGKYVKNRYSDSKTDMFTVFIERCNKFVALSGFQAMITQQQWMFSSIYSNLRSKISKNNIMSLLQLGARAFDEISGEVVQTTTFSLRKSMVENYVGIFFDLTSGQSEKEKRDMYINRQKRYFAKYSDFEYVPNVSMAYWLSKEALENFKQKKICDSYTTREGMTTADNERFIRCWYELEYEKIGLGINNEEEALLSGKKWFPYNKGGNNKKWYGNNELVVNWQNKGAEIKSIKDEKSGRIRSHNYNAEYSFRESGTWTSICSGDIMVRYSKPGALFDSKGASIFANNHKNLLYIIGLLNSKVSNVYLKVLSPSFEYKVGHIANIPLVENEKNKGYVIELAKNCISIAKEDWDSYEISFDFAKNPIVDFKYCNIKEAYNDYRKLIEYRNKQMIENEIEINRCMIEVFKLQNELTSEVDDKDVTIRKADLQRDIKSLLSYAVGCMFGRYSLKKEGLMFAGGSMEDIYQIHSGKLDGSFSLNGIFPMDGKTYYYLDGDDYLISGSNIIPITDEEYLEDDIVRLLCVWLKKAYGEETLEENLDFIAAALGNKGNTSREIIRNYFLNDFFKDHCATYSVTGSGKRPIYWLFDSGKQSGFKALIYMHRYNADTIGNLRVDYLHRMERIYESEINRMQDTVDNSTVAREVTAATKRKEKLQKQLKECKEYDEKIGHLALSRIEIDLDDGVKVNYEKMQTANDGKKYQVLAKI